MSSAVCKMYLRKAVTLKNSEEALYVLICMYPYFVCGEKAVCRRMIMCLLCKEGENILTFVSICSENYEAQFPF